MRFSQLLIIFSFSLITNSCAAEDLRREPNRNEELTSKPPEQNVDKHSERARLAAKPIIQVVAVKVPEKKAGPAAAAKGLSPDETIALAIEAVGSTEIKSPAGTPAPAAPVSKQLSPEKTALRSRDDVPAGAYIQISAERDKEKALAKAAELRNKGTDAAVQTAIVDETTYYRVLVGPYGTRRGAAERLSRYENHPLAVGVPFVRVLP